MAANETTNQGAANSTRLVTLKQSWADFEFGPYERFPEPRRLVLEGYLMQRYDPTVGAALKLYKRLIVSRLGNYTHPEERLQEFVRAVLKRLSGGLENTISRLLSCQWAGFAVAAKRWRTNKSAWWLEGLDLLHPLTFFPPHTDPKKQGFQVDANGNVELFRQFPAEALQNPMEFTREQVLYWPFMQELREEVTGKRLTDAARRPWFMRVKAESNWGIYLEKSAYPIPIFRVPKGMQVDSRGVKISNGEFYGGFIGNLTAGQGLAIEADGEENFNFDLLESRVGGDRAYESAAKYYNAEIFKAMLTSPLMFEEASHGTRAQGVTALEITLMLVEAIREELGGVLVWELARPLIDYNYGPRDDYGKWEFEDLRDDDLDMLAAVHQRIAMAGSIIPTEADDAAARDKFAPAGFATADEVTPEMTARERGDAGARSARQGYGI